MEFSSKENGEHLWNVWMKKLKKQKSPSLYVPPRKNPHVKIINKDSKHHKGTN